MPQVQGGSPAPAELAPVLLPTPNPSHQQPTFVRTVRLVFDALDRVGSSARRTGNRSGISTLAGRTTGTSGGRAAESEATVDRTGST
jgi:hypothetical protein